MPGPGCTVGISSGGAGSVWVRHFGKPLCRLVVRGRFSRFSSASRLAVWRILGGVGSRQAGRGGGRAGDAMCSSRPDVKSMSFLWSGRPVPKAANLRPIFMMLRESERCGGLVKESVSFS